MGGTQMRTPGTLEGDGGMAARDADKADDGGSTAPAAKVPVNRAIALRVPGRCRTPLTDLPCRPHAPMATLQTATIAP